jgi:general secretion pathway protein D
MKALVVLLAAALAGCAANETYREGRALVEAGEVEEGLARIEQALEADPYDREMRNFYLRNRTLAVQRYLSMGARARSAGALDQAEAAYQRALRFDPDNARARAGLGAIAQNRRSAAAVAQAESLMKRGDSEAAYARAKEILSHNPRQRTARAIVRQVEMMKARAQTFSPSLNAALG